MEHVQRLIAAGISPADIGVITPYNAQARLRGTLGWRSGWFALLGPGWARLGWAQRPQPAGFQQHRPLLSLLPTFSF